VPLNLQQKILFATTCKTRRHSMQNCKLVRRRSFVQIFLETA